MKNIDIEYDIDYALQNIEMPDTIKELLITLREEIPKAKTNEEKLQIAFKWMELISTVATIVSTFHPQ